MKMKTIALLCAMVLGFGSVANAESYVNGIDANYPPFGYVDESGNPAGFDVDAMNWIAEEMGFEVTHQPMDWDGIIPALLSDKIDMIASGMSITPERQEQVNFSTPYFQFEKVMIGRAGTDLTVERVYAEPIQLGVQRGTSEHDFLETMIEEEGYAYELRFYDSSPLAVEDLLNGRIDAVALDYFPATDAISKGKEVEIFGAFIQDDSFGVAVRKEDTALLEMINEGYERLMADPYWEELQQIHLAESE